MIYLIKYRSKFLFLLSCYLLFSSIVEGIGAYIIRIKRSSYLLYFIYSLFQFNLLGLIYYHIIDSEKLRKLIVCLTLVFSALWIIVIFNRNLFFYLVILGAINTRVFAFLYLRTLLLSDKILNYKKLLPFWVSVGFLVFYFPSVPFFSLIGYMKDRGLFFIINILVILMNLFIIFGLACANKKDKYL